MMEKYDEIKKKVLDANLLLVKYGLVTLTWGNVSEIDRGSGIVAIKPSGVAYENMFVDDIVIVDLDGKVIEGNLKPSSDLATHLELYKSFPSIGGVVHTHSEYATSWAQSRRSIPCYGTTHADTFYTEIPCTRLMLEDEINTMYEKNTGKVIVETFKSLNYDECHAVLCPHHGPFCWGSNAENAVEHALILERVAKMAYLTEMLNNNCSVAPQSLIDKHFLRKHGKNAYYGQNTK